MKKTVLTITAFILSILFALSFSGCEKEKEQSEKPTPPEPPVQETVIELEIQASEITNQFSSATIYKSIEYDFSCALYIDDVEYSQLNAVSWTVSNSEILSLTVNGTTAKLIGLQVGSAELTASAEYQGKTYSDKITVYVYELSRIRPSISNAVLFTSTDVSGNPVNEINQTEVEVSCYDNNTTSVNIVDSGLINWQSTDMSVVSVDNGIISVVGNGSCVVTGTYKNESFDITVDVFTPIYSASDLDTLALVTYKKSKNDAEKYLSSNYMLMKDIDYSKHIRNFFLPIASPTLADCISYANTLACAGGDNSPYSLVWKQILNLEERDVNGVSILYNDDGTEFTGINPNGIHFSGIFDGNGYAIKNAWFMMENMLFKTIYNAVYRYGSGNCCFIGNNDGTLRNLSFENVEIGANETFCKTSASGERYYEYNINPSHYWLQQNEAKVQELEANNPMYVAYRGKTFKSYKGSTEKFDTWTLYASRFTDGNGFVLKNTGVIQNVYCKYRNDCNVTPVMNSGGLCLINEGIIDHCILELDLLTYSGGTERSMEACCPISVANYGTISNVAVITDRVCDLIKSDQGAISNVAQYLVLSDLTSNATVLKDYDSKKWKFTDKIQTVKNNYKIKDVIASGERIFIDPYNK